MHRIGLCAFVSSWLKGPGVFLDAILKILQPYPHAHPDSPRFP